MRIRSSLRVQVSGGTSDLILEKLNLTQAIEHGWTNVFSKESITTNGNSSSEHPSKISRRIIPAIFRSVPLVKLFDLFALP